MSSPSPLTSSLPPRPRLVLRLGFAGRKELTAPEQHLVADSLHQVMQTLAKHLSSIAPGTPVEAGKEPPVSAFFAKQCPLLRLVTGLCEGADAVAAEALTKVSVSPDAGASCPLGTPCIETELAAVLPFDVETYRASRPAAFLPQFDDQLSRCAWVLALDGIYDKPNPDTPFAQHRRSRAYRGQSAFLLRQSDILIAAANPDEPGKAGGTLETVPIQKSKINNPQSSISAAASVTQLTADPDNGLTTDSPHGAEYRKHGESLLTEFFDHSDSPARQEKQWLPRLRKSAWSFFEKRFKSGESVVPYPKVTEWVELDARLSSLKHSTRKQTSTILLSKPIGQVHEG